jgi:hypothetical protein
LSASPPRLVVACENTCWPLNSGLASDLVDALQQLVGFRLQRLPVGAAQRAVGGLH